MGGLMEFDVFQVLQTEEKKVRKKLQSMKYSMLETRKDGTKFTSKPLKEAAALLQNISKEYESRQQQLVKEVRNILLPDIIGRSLSSFVDGGVAPGVA
jgi:DNA mismatch repair ATPase MutS